MKKIRADAVLKNLPQERQARIWDMLTTQKKTLAATRKHLAADGIKVSEQTVSKWYSWYARNVQPSCRVLAVAVLEIQPRPGGSK